VCIDTLLLSWFLRSMRTHLLGSLETSTGVDSRRAMMRLSITKIRAEGTSVERRVEKMEDLKQAKELIACMPRKGPRHHNYIDRLAHDVRIGRLDPNVFKRFMEAIGG